MRNNGSLELLGNTKLNQFQLTEPLLAGKRFFDYTLHYLNMLEQVQQKIEGFHEREELPNGGAGDRYVRQLYENTLLFIADRFGISTINETVMKKIYMMLFLKAYYVRSIR